MIINQSLKWTRVVVEATILWAAICPLYIWANEIPDVIRNDTRISGLQDQESMPVQYHAIYQDESTVVWTKAVLKQGSGLIMLENGIAGAIFIVTNDQIVHTRYYGTEAPRYQPQAIADGSGRLFILYYEWEKVEEAARWPKLVAVVEHWNGSSTRELLRWEFAPFTIADGKLRTETQLVMMLAGISSEVRVVAIETQVLDVSAIDAGGVGDTIVATWSWNQDENRLVKVGEPHRK